MDGNRYSDDLLVEKFRDGDAESFDAIIAKYQVVVFSLAMHLINDEVQSGNVAREVFVELSRELKENKPDAVEVLVHRLTYEASIKRILQRVGGGDDFLEIPADAMRSAILCHSSKSEISKVGKNDKEKSSFLAILDAGRVGSQDASPQVASEGVNLDGVVENQAEGSESEAVEEEKMSSDDPRLILS